MNTRIGRSTRNFSSKVPCFVLLTNARLKYDDHSRMSMQTGVDIMSSTEAGCPASKLTKADLVPEHSKLTSEFLDVLWLAPF